MSGNQSTKMPFKNGNGEFAIIQDFELKYPTFLNDFEQLVQNFDYLEIEVKRKLVQLTANFMLQLSQNPTTQLEKQYLKDIETILITSQQRNRLKHQLEFAAVAASLFMVENGAKALTIASAILFIPAVIGFLAIVTNPLFFSVVFLTLITSPITIFLLVIGGVKIIESINDFKNDTLDQLNAQKTVDVARIESGNKAYVEIIGFFSTNATTKTQDFQTVRAKYS